jgi:hypothetical protein
MLRIIRFFENQFDDPQFSDDEMRAFGTDHLAKTAAYGDPDFDEILSATDTALTNFNAKVSDESTALAIRKARTTATNTLLAKLHTLWNQREGKIRDAYGKGTEKYIEFYPAGIAEYTEAGVGEIEKLLTRYAKAAADNKEVLGQPFADEWSGLKTQWIAVRGTQVSQKGTASTAADANTSARKALEIQLMVNILTIAAKYVGQPEKAAVFFNQSLLENPTRTASAATTTTTTTTNPLTK